VLGQVTWQVCAVRVSIFIVVYAEAIGFIALNYEYKAEDFGTMRTNSL